jgi:sensor histidine kinase YesM
MIFQPFIENAIWHAFGHGSKDTLVIEFAQSDDGKSIDIRIKDNGIGRKMSMARNKNRSHKSKGMQLIKERIDILNVSTWQKIELSIHDLEDVQGNHPGTLVIIKIPSL